VRSSDDEAARRVDVVDGVLVKVLRRDDRLDDVLVDVRGDLVVRHRLVVLRGEQDRVHADRHHGAALVLVLDRHLRLAVRAQPRADSVLAHLRELVSELRREHVRERHELGRLVRGVSKHVALVAGADLLERLGSHAVHTLADIGGLLLELHHNLARLVVKALLGSVEADLLASLAHNLLVVHLRLGGDLAEHHHHARLGARLAGNLGVRVLLEHGVKHGIGHLIAELVRVSLVHGLGGEKEGRHIFCDLKMW